MTLSDHPYRGAMSIAEFCRRFGVSRATLNRWRQKGLGPDEVHVGGRVLLTYEAIDEWQRRHKRPTTT